MESSDRGPFDFYAMEARGARVLTEGLSSFPAEFTPSTTTPLAYWKNESFGIVTFLAGPPSVQSHLKPTIWTGKYDRKNDEWTPKLPWYAGPGQGIQRPPGQPDDTDGSAVTLSGRSDGTPEEGGPALIVWGWCSTKVVQLSLRQSHDSVIIPIGHLGSWVIGSQSKDPWTIEARDGSGNRLGSVDQHQWSG